MSRVNLHEGLIFRRPVTKERHRMLIRTVLCCAVSLYAVKLCVDLLQSSHPRGGLNTSPTLRDNSHERYAYRRRAAKNSAANPTFFEVHTSRGQQSSRHAIATFFASHDFTAALEVFVSTLADTNTVHTLVVCIPKVANSTSLVQTADRVLTKNHLPSFQIVLLNVIPSPFHGSVRSRWAVNWTKLGLWSMTQFDAIFYVDLDVMFLRNVDHVFKLFTRVFMGTRDWGRYTPLSSNKMNGGVFLMEPSLEVFDKLLMLKDRAGLYAVSEAEQGLINEFFKGYDCLPYLFNVQKTVLLHIPDLWDLSGTYILHFTGEKPWTAWSTTEFRKRFVDESIIKKLKEDDSFDADDFASLHDLWKQKYMETRREDLQKLTIYQSYHDESCWAHVRNEPYYRGLRLSGPLREPEDVDGPAHFRDLSNSRFQLAIGEFGAMMAVDAMPIDDLPPFVGFTSWKAYVKEDWKEGATIDWTKVDFQPDTIYFWYSLYGNKSFDRVIESQHAGMTSIIAALVDFDISCMTENHYAYSNYFIASKSTFKRYMADAKRLLSRFIEMYPIGSPCPFSLPEDTYKPEDRCAGYVLERYINIWAIQNGVKLVYAVDHPEWRNK